MWKLLLDKISQGIILPCPLNIGKTGLSLLGKKTNKTKPKKHPPKNQKTNPYSMISYFHYFNSYFIIHAGQAVWNSQLG